MFHSFVEFHILLLLKLSERESCGYLWTKLPELCHWTATGKIGKNAALKPLQSIKHNFKHCFSILQSIAHAGWLPSLAQYSPVIPLDGSIKEDFRKIMFLKEILSTPATSTLQY